MSDVDLDEDLLALAGAGGSDVSDSDSDAPLATHDKKRSSSSKTSATKKRKTSSYDSDDGEDYDDDDDYGNNDDDSTEKNPYPLEGKYIDEDDKNRIEAMDEIAREELLYSRAQEMNEYNERVYLAQRAAREKSKVRDDRAKRSRSVKESAKSTKSSKLSELKKQRDKKARKEAGDEYSEDEQEGGENDDYDLGEEYEDEGENDDYDLGDGYEDEDDYNPDQVEWATTEKQPARQVELSDINKIRIGRIQAAKFLYYPEFKEVIKDCVARFNIGINRQTGQPIYRMVRILGVEHGRKPYRLEKFNVNLFAICSVGKGDPKKVSMDFFSNSPLTQEELDKYKSYEGTVPSLKKIDKKYAELKTMATRVLTPKEINEVTQKKQVLNRDYTGANAVIRRAELEAKLDVAKQQHNVSEIQRIEHELLKYELAKQKQIAESNKHDKLGNLDKVNERNRRKNQDLIRKAEVIAAEKRRKEMTTGVTSNPFSRLKTNVRSYYQSVQQEAAEKAQEEAVAEEAKQKAREKDQEKFFVKAKYRQVGELDKLIKESIDINFSI